MYGNACGLPWVIQPAACPVVRSENDPVSSSPAPSRDDDRHSTNRASRRSAQVASAEERTDPERLSEGNRPPKRPEQESCDRSRRTVNTTPPRGFGDANPPTNDGHRACESEKHRHILRSQATNHKVVQSLNQPPMSFCYGPVAQLKK